MDFKESLQTIKIKMEKTQNKDNFDVASYLNTMIIKLYKKKKHIITFKKTTKYIN